VELANRTTFDNDSSHRSGARGYLRPLTAKILLPSSQNNRIPDLLGAYPPWITAYHRLFAARYIRLLTGPFLFAADYAAIAKWLETHFWATNDDATRCRAVSQGRSAPMKRSATVGLATAWSRTEGLRPWDHGGLHYDDALPRNNVRLQEW
jgi:hypothetical protein